MIWLKKYFIYIQPFVFIFLILGCSEKKYRENPATVLKIYDGDTIRVIWKGKKERIRFLGVNAPEMNEPGGEEAKKQVQEKFPVGSTVYLKFKNGKPIRDKWGRILAWVEN